MSVNYYLFDQGEQRGPYSLEQVGEMWRAGLITAEAQICQAGDEDWQPVGNRFATEEPPREVQDSKRGGCLRIFGIVFAGFMLCMLIIAFSAAFKPTGQTSSGISDTTVRTMTENLVRNQLKAPSTARFSGRAETVISKQPGGEYLVAGWVESQNAFGVPLRNRYGARVQTHDGNTFRLLDLKLE
jgi:hypothetical protein